MNDAVRYCKRESKYEIKLIERETNGWNSTAPYYVLTCYIRQKTVPSVFFHSMWITFNRQTGRCLSGKQNLWKIMVMMMMLVHLFHNDYVWELLIWKPIFPYFFFFCFSRFLFMLVLAIVWYNGEFFNFKRVQEWKTENIYQRE